MNKIGASGATAVSESLKTNTTLTTLNMGGDYKIEKENRNKKAGGSLGAYAVLGAKDVFEEERAISFLARCL